MDALKISHVTSTISRLGGGLFESVRRLSQETQKIGIEIEVLGLQDQFSELDKVRWSPMPVHLFPVQGPPRFGFAPELDHYLAGSGPDMVHLHGVWQYPTSSVLRWARATGKPYVVSAHGMLEPWALKRSRLKKAAVNWLYQRACLREAACLRATSASEAESYWRLGLKNPIAVIPNGVSAPPGLEYRKSDIGKRRFQKRRVLFMSRIHPKKGLLNLVRAWAEVCREQGVGSGKQNNERSTFNAQLSTFNIGFNDREWGTQIGNRILVNWELVIIGPDEGGHLAEVMDLVRELGLQEQIRYGGEIWQEDAKWRCYQEAELFVLPSYSENFGLVIAEALGCGVPVITTRATPWEELETRRCGWWIDTGKEPLVQALGAAMSVPVEELQAMGARGRQLILDKYSWAPIGRQMADVYEWLAGRRDKPACLVGF